MYRQRLKMPNGCIVNIFLPHFFVRPAGRGGSWHRPPRGGGGGGGINRLGVLAEGGHAARIPYQSGVRQVSLIGVGYFLPFSCYKYSNSAVQKHASCPSADSGNACNLACTLALLC